MLPLRIACAIGVADSVVALATAVFTRPEPASMIVGVVWVVAWAAALWRAPSVARVVAARPEVLVVLGAVTMAPALLDGGWPGTLATQPTWLVVVAAATGAGVAVTLATGVALCVAKGLVFAATGSTAEELFPASGPTLVATELVAPVAIALLALVLVGALRRMLAAVEEAVAPPASPAFTPAEREVVALLAGGLTAKEIARRRGTSVATVRTQIKRAKRAAGARTLDELVATAWRVG